MIVEYSEKYEKAWDRFVMEESCNGTFLQTRNFLNYHDPSRFKDNSLMFMKGTSIIAVIPAHVCVIENKKVFFSHLGSTFGGIILGKQNKKISDVKNLFEELDLYLNDNGFSKVLFKLTSLFYSKEKSELLDYFLFLNGYQCICEMGYYIDLSKYNVLDIPSNFNSSRRRGYKHSQKYDLVFSELVADEKIADFYAVLCDNMKKFGTNPIHSLDELFDLRERLEDSIKFYGVFEKNEIIAGSMVFCFEKNIFHTQYLASNQSKLMLYPSEFLYTNLIQETINLGYRYISFGTSTLDHGKILNSTLAQFKEGFGTKEYINRTYCKDIN